MHPLRASFQHHWRLYVDEGIELAIFMISACFFTVWLFNPAWPILHLLPSSAVRRLLMGISMGATAILIIRSPAGKRSGAHFNPAITLTYFRLGKIDKWDAGFYVASQFIGGICGVGLSALCLRGSLAAPSVDYAVTIPGLGGPAAAFGAEYFMAALLMLIVLWLSNRPPLAQYTSYVVGVLICFTYLSLRPFRVSVLTLRERPPPPFLPTCGLRHGSILLRRCSACSHRRRFTCVFAAQSVSSAPNYIPIQVIRAHFSASSPSTATHMRRSSQPKQIILDLRKEPSESDASSV